MGDFAFETERLILRDWRGTDLTALHAICSDPQVMEYLGPVQTQAEVGDAIEWQRALQGEHGHCYWAIERKSDNAMIGFCGLILEPEGTPIAGQIDIGWRLAATEWGKGYAREAALASLNWGFAHLTVDIIWAITVPANLRSWGLMERIGMARHFDLDFDHPAVPDGSPLKRHLTYGITRDEWDACRGE
jgi:RimJ/RimL family protein N-acetyltransferase